MAKFSTEFQVIDSTFTAVGNEAVNILDGHYQFTQTYYVQTPYNKQRKQKIKYVIARTKDGCFLPTGMVADAVQIMNRNGWDVEIKGKYKRVKTKKPKLEGITFRPDQMRQIKSIVLSDWQRGVVVAPTGTGKTIVLMGIISSLYPESRILFLAHTTDLVRQFHQELVEKGFKDANIISGNSYEFGSLSCCTIQKLSRIPAKEWKDKYDAIIVDEAHRVSGFKGQYSSVLMSSSAKIKIGCTATPPVDDEARMSLHGLLGPIVDTVTMQEAADHGMIVMPTVTMLTYTPATEYADIRSYPDVYDRFVVKNTRRNDMILDLVEKYLKEGKSIMVGVKKIDHLNILLTQAKRRGIKIYGAQGKTSKDERVEIISKMKSGEFRAVISTKVFNEGINIPKLDVIVNAASGKSVTESLQRPGRGTRLAEGKTEVLLFDILDPVRYLAEHAIERIRIYTQQNWNISVIDPYASDFLKKKKGE